MKTTTREAAGSVAGHRDDVMMTAAGVAGIRDRG
jgi:hypothetical protein